MGYDTRGEKLTGREELICLRALTIVGVIMLASALLWGLLPRASGDYGPGQAGSISGPLAIAALATLVYVTVRMAVLYSKGKNGTGKGGGRN